MQPVVDLNNLLGYIGISTQFTIVVLFSAVVVFLTRARFTGEIVAAATLSALPFELILHSSWGTIIFFAALVFWAILVATLFSAGAKLNKDEQEKKEKATAKTS